MTLTQAKKVPRHVALIMDGNLRWARARQLPYIEGLRAGARVIQPIVEHAHAVGVKHITFWALSTENWRRGPEFTRNLFAVFREFLAQKSLFDNLVKRGGKLHVFGDLSELPSDVVQRLDNYLNQEPEEKEIDVNFCLNYGGRAEIVRAVKQIIQAGLVAEAVTQERFAQYLYTVGQPDPDLIIRTSGEQRLSGFMPWQAVYAEFYFTETLWPDFSPDGFDQALFEYSRRDRRFGRQSKN